MKLSNRKRWYKILLYTTMPSHVTYHDNSLRLRGFLLIYPFQLDSHRRFFSNVLLLCWLIFVNNMLLVVIHFLCFRHPLFRFPLPLPPFFFPSELYCVDLSGMAVDHRATISLSRLTPIGSRCIYFCRRQARSSAVRSKEVRWIHPLPGNCWTSSPI